MLMYIYQARNSTNHIYHFGLVGNLTKTAHNNFAVSACYTVILKGSVYDISDVRRVTENIERSLKKIKINYSTQTKLVSFGAIE